MRGRIAVASVFVAAVVAAPVQAQAPIRLSTDGAVTAMVEAAASRIRSATAGQGYKKHAFFLRALAVESNAPRGVGTMNGIGVAKIDAAMVRAAGLTDDDVAWMIAHEYAHFILKHPARRMLASPDGERVRDHADATKALELEADRLGLRLALAAGYSFDPHAFFTRLRGGRLAGESATHPADVLRVRAMRR